MTIHQMLWSMSDPTEVIGNVYQLSRGASRMYRLDDSVFFERFDENDKKKDYYIEFDVEEYRQAIREVQETGSAIIVSKDPGTESGYRSKMVLEALERDSVRLYFFIHPRHFGDASKNVCSTLKLDELVLKDN